MHYFCINLRRRLDRWQQMQNEFAKHNLTVHRWDAIDATTYNISGPLAASCSHRTLLYFCQLSHIYPVVIFEDDVVLHKNFNIQLNQIMSLLPLDWDGLSLHAFKAKTEYINSYLCKLLSPTYGAHGIVLSQRGISKLFQNQSSMCLEDVYFNSLDNFYGVNLDHTLAFQTGIDSDIPETSIIHEYHNFYDKYKHLHC